MTLATIQRGPFGHLLVLIEPHPRSGERMIVLKHVRADGAPGPRAPLQASEIDQVISALQLASKTLVAKVAQHRTVSASDAERELERKLF